ncbi:unnamed protein product [Caenorhabditis auriculariae]|uniref:Uncharacterized protein n=1 Tax=Caenorhabditis auriculariae TaxID=2777116 RepID=A0A8S1H7H5_9PELO|nr:unnamed protein product [Caenorhabditis auriculariae]
MQKRYAFCALLLVISSLLASEEVEEEDEEKPHVAWVPIVKRDKNISAAIGESLTEVEEEKLERIGKMLAESYDKMDRDANEGETKIKEKIIGKATNASPVHFVSFFSVFSCILPFMR